MRLFGWGDSSHVTSPGGMDIANNKLTCTFRGCNLRAYREREIHQQSQFEGYRFISRSLCTSHSQKGKGKTDHHYHRTTITTTPVTTNSTQKDGKDSAARACDTRTQERSRTGQQQVQHFPFCLSCTSWTHTGQPRSSLSLKPLRTFIYHMGKEATPAPTFPSRTVRGQETATAIASAPRDPNKSTLEGKLALQKVNTIIASSAHLVCEHAHTRRAACAYNAQAHRGWRGSLRVCYLSSIQKIA